MKLQQKYLHGMIGGKKETKMTEKKTNVITVNEKEYDVDAMTDKQKTLLNHVSDLERKIGSTQFNLDQLVIGREAFAERLVDALENPEVEEEAAGKAAIAG
jgi:hypothetical protein